MKGIQIHIVETNEDANAKSQARAALAKARGEEVGDTICCPSCGKNFKKKSYQQKFHSTKCKDIYWNSVDPVRRERAKRFK